MSSKQLGTVSELGEGGSKYGFEVLMKVTTMASGAKTRMKARKEKSQFL